MRAFQIQDNLGFMKKLLVTDVFDAFLLSEASITTFAEFQIDGTFHAGYLGKNDLPAEEEAGGYTLWKRIRPFFFELTKGKNTPLRFHIVFRLAPRNVEKLLAQTGISMTQGEIGGLFLNITFDGSSISATSGVSLRVFTMDKTLEHAWDEMTERFFRQRQIPFL